MIILYFCVQDDNLLELFFVFDNTYLGIMGYNGHIANWLIKYYGNIVLYDFNNLKLKFTDVLKNGLWFLFRLYMCRLYTSTN